jgi:hypothetical protein
MFPGAQRLEEWDLALQESFSNVCEDFSFHEVGVLLEEDTR